MSTTEITTRTIFEESIKDIEAGRWMCGHLCSTEDITGNKYEKPMGCALGLIAINAGTGDEKGRVGYPTSAWPQAGIEAVKLLARETDTYWLTRLETDPSYEMSMSDYEDAVVGYNDAHGDAALTPELAKAWFERALAKA